ncbi:hypothetical protein [Jeotgalibacillus proteolyticus]|uniref:hypothetical protein n=1 Tax=Jeotgalibacillus proteolyticus TaxID=2082395 RepID=UPI003CEAF57E
MDLLLWMTVGLITLGFILAFVTRNLGSKKSTTIQSIVWGIAGIFLIVWWLFTK